MDNDVPVLAFVRERVPEGPPAWRWTARLLQVLAWTFAAAAVLYTAITAWMLTRAAGSGTMEGPWLATFVAAGLFGLISAVGLALAFAWWASYSYGHWCRRRRTGYGHALALGILGVLMVSAAFDFKDMAGGSWQAFSVVALTGVQVVLNVAVVIGCCLPSVRREFKVPAALAAHATAP